MTNQKELHILKIIHGYPPVYNAGSEVYSQHIVNHLSARHQVTVFTREENPYLPHHHLREFSTEEGIRFCIINNPHGRNAFQNEEIDWKFKEIVLRRKPDVVHIGHLNHLSTGLVGVIHDLGIPIVFTLHDFWLMCPRGQFLTRSLDATKNFQLCDKQVDVKCASVCYSMGYCGTPQTHAQDLQYWTSWIGTRMATMKEICGKVSRFIAPSQYLRRRFISDFNLPEEKVSYLDYGFPIQAALIREEREVYTFGYIGTHIPAKGLNQLIEAFAHLREPAKLLIYGRNSGMGADTLRSLAAQSHNPIEFVGEYQNDEINTAVFAKVDCIIVPSIWTENSPLVIHEAQACRIPVITAAAGGMQEYVQHQINGLLFEHRSISSLARQIKYAVRHPEDMRQLGKRGYLISEDGNVPSIAAHCEELEHYYKAVIAEKHASVGTLWRVTLDTNPEDCNLHCIMCEEHSPYSDYIPAMERETGIKRRRMGIDTVRKVFDEAQSLGIMEIIPSTMGEPLLYKGIELVFELAQARDIKINLTTNGTFPKKSVQDWAALIVPATSDVKISWNAATESTAREVMPGIDFPKALSNLQAFIAYRNEYYRNTGVYCSVTLQLTFLQSNMHELAEIVKLAAAKDVDRVKGHHLWVHFEEIAQLSMKASETAITQWNAYVQEAKQAQKQYRRPDGSQVRLENIEELVPRHENAVPDHYECPFLGKELWISATGKISPCCAPDKQRDTLGDFGNIALQSLEEVLNSTVYRALQANYKQHPLCQKCLMRKPL